MSRALPDLPPSPAPQRIPSETRTALAGRFQATRAATRSLCAGLSAEDQCVQAMPDASPTKWHLGHTSWFFETVLLVPHLPGYSVFDPRFGQLFNSYYEAAGPRHPRPARGLLTRPAIEVVHAYRDHVEAALLELIATADDGQWDRIAGEITLGIQHEQQHQELIVTDILNLFSRNPLLPAYRGPSTAPGIAAEPARATAWIEQPGGVVEIGAGAEGFAFDNERPRHAVLLQPHAIASNLVCCGEFAAFIAEGGYRRPEFWLSEGWALVQEHGWQAPGYWFAAEDPRVAGHAAAAGAYSPWLVFGPAGLAPMDPQQPVAQLSFYEACAFAAWAGGRLPTEFEWEHASQHPDFRQATGAVWQWTRSAYAPYPGFRPLQGFAAEYNGKFMVNQLVLRGGSLATPTGHSRPSYRNFFPASARWQFSGLRLARDLD